MKVLSEELQQALLAVLTKWRDLDADAVERRLFDDKYPELSYALAKLDAVSSDPQPRNADSDRTQWGQVPKPRG